MSVYKEAALAYMISWQLFSGSVRPHMCLFPFHPFFAVFRGEQRTICHKKARRYISPCRYEPLSLSIIDGEIQSRTHVSQWWTEMPGGQMMTPVIEWPGLSQARSLPLLTLTCMSRHPPLTDLSPGGLFFLGLEWSFVVGEKDLCNISQMSKR